MEQDSYRQGVCTTCSLIVVASFIWRSRTYNSLILKPENLSLCTMFVRHVVADITSCSVHAQRMVKVITDSVDLPYQSCIFGARFLPLAVANGRGVQLFEVFTFNPTHGLWTHCTVEENCGYGRQVTELARKWKHHM